MSRSVLPPAVLVVALAFAGACAQESSSHSLMSADPTEEGEQPETPDDLDAVVDAALEDVQRFWRETYPEVYREPFEELAGGFHPYGPNTEMPPCGPDPISYEEIADNAFYCPIDDLIAWDEATLIPQLAEDFGPFTVGIVFAHEFGHAIQFRAGVENQPTIVMEMQADCFAGAWTRWIEQGNSDDFSVTESELDESVAGMTSIADLAGTEAQDPLAHGSGFDRIGSFQDGFDNGAAQCTEYPDLAQSNELPIVEIPFTSAEELATGGNLHLEDRGPDEPGLLTLSAANLNVFYDVIFTELGAGGWQPVDDLVVLDSSTGSLTCDGEELDPDDLGFASGYCEDENIAVLGVDLMDALNDVEARLGDFAVASEIARLWTRAAQLQLDVDVDDLPAASLQADCLTGVWADANFPLPPDGSSTKLQQEVGDTSIEGVGLTLSAGDLDEAIRGFLTWGDTLEEETGTAFERTDALRDGFVTGLSACEEFAPLG